MSDDPAMARFAIIQLMRWTGVVLTAFGLLILAGRVDLPRAAGYALAAVGLFDALILPIFLAKRWKSPPQ